MALKFDVVIEREGVTRKCSKCSQVYPLSAAFFEPNGHNRDRTLAYFRPECRGCRSKETKERNEAYKQAGKPKRPAKGTPCELCGRTTQTLVFDHCHASLKHRGWLCNSCNKGLGLIGDSVEALERAILYLKREV